MKKGLKKSHNVRVYPEIRIAILKKFGSLQAFIDLMIEKEIGQFKMFLNKKEK